MPLLIVIASALEPPGSSAPFADRARGVVGLAVAGGMRSNPISQAEANILETFRAILHVSFRLDKSFHNNHLMSHISHLRAPGAGLSRCPVFWVGRNPGQGDARRDMRL
jgi:hypothetical protein